MAFTVGEIARMTGVAAKTIRYYEEVGVLPAAARTAAGYRQYTERDVHRLRFIRRARALGLSVQHLKPLAAMLDDGRGRAVRPRLLVTVRAQLSAVEERIGEMRLLKRQLRQVLRRLRRCSPAQGAGGCRCLDPVEMPAPRQRGPQTMSRHV